MCASKNVPWRQDASCKNVLLFPPGRGWHCPHCGGSCEMVGLLSESHPGPLTLWGNKVEIGPVLVPAPVGPFFRRPKPVSHFGEELLGGESLGLPLSPAKAARGLWKPPRGLPLRADNEGAWGKSAAARGLTEPGLRLRKTTQPRPWRYGPLSRKFFPISGPVCLEGSAAHRSRGHMFPLNVSTTWRKNMSVFL